MSWIHKFQKVKYFHFPYKCCLKEYWGVLFFKKYRNVFLFLNFLKVHTCKTWLMWRRIFNNKQIPNYRPSKIYKEIEIYLPTYAYCINLYIIIIITCKTENMKNPMKHIFDCCWNYFCILYKCASCGLLMQTTSIQ